MSNTIEIIRDIIEKSVSLIPKLAGDADGVPAEIPYNETSFFAYPGKEVYGRGGPYKVGFGIAHQGDEETDENFYITDKMVLVERNYDGKLFVLTNEEIADLHQRLLIYYNIALSTTPQQK